jgi:BirA family biotin operon repressor/biotin-[acetyl-CoA-carboxylase] ligase
MSAEVDRTAWVVVGIGLNANNDFSGTLASQAVSLRMVLGREVDRSSLVAALLSRIAEGYAAYCREGLAPALPAYHERSLLLGRRVRVDTGNGGICDGIFERVDADGFLWLKMPDERRERVIAGSIISPERNMP